MPAPLALDVPRDARELVRTSVATWVRHLPLFVVLAALVVVPIEGALRAAGGTAASAVAVAASFIVIPALVTALHVVAVLDLGRGVRPGLGRSLAVTLRVAPAVLWVVLLFTLGVLVGLLVLVAPGIFLSVHWYFGAQVAVVEGLRGPAALRRSGRLVGHRWGRVFALLLVLGFLPAAVNALVVAVANLQVSERTGWVFATAAECAAVSFTALAATLLYFDLRARSEDAWR